MKAEEPEDHEGDAALVLRTLKLQKVSRLDTLVTVADSSILFNVIRGKETLDSSILTEKEFQQAVETNSGEAENAKRGVADLLCDQLEFANVIVLNKADLIEETEKPLVQNLVKKLNPNAEIVWSSFGKVNPKHLLSMLL